MERVEHPLHHFFEFTEEIYEVYKREGLESLKQITDGDTRLDSTFSTILNRKQNLYPLPHSIFKLQEELSFITQDIMYVTGLLYYFRPYIVDVAETNAVYKQNLPDHRYLTYATFGMQSIYNYWDRIGDILYIYFETGLKPKSVYFGSVLNNINPKYQESEYFIQLNKIYQDEIKPFIDERNTAVHSYQLETKYYWGNVELQGEANRVERENLNTEKHSYPEKYKHHLELCITGFRLMLNLIDTLPDKSY
ncbi:Cthe_2314 family HEPN domain-containing protein [Hymenobacter sp. 102]|uniref:Cthe_2314 family HEPN domain-containing protein n=1 Tax=Hymenobacter sp. 102 TaxID=3403152 RepID=UPI003CF94215